MKLLLEDIEHIFQKGLPIVCKRNRQCSNEWKKNNTKDEFVGRTLLEIMKTEVRKKRLYGDHYEMKIPADLPDDEDIHF